MPIIMHSEHQTSEQAGYEVSDLNPSVVIYLLSAITLVAALSFVITIMVVRYFDESRRGAAYNREVPVTSGVGEIDQTPTVSYTLQRRPEQERETIYGPQREQIGSYGVLTDAQGVERARIPVERAMELLVQGAVEYRQEPTVALLGGGAAEADDTTE